MVRWTVGLFMGLAGLGIAGAQTPDEAQRAELGRYFGFGPLQIYKVQPGIGQLKIADLNGDGRKDIAFWNRRKARIEVFYQSDSATATTSAPATATDLERNEISSRGPLRNENIPVSYSIAALEIADLTGDKRPDIVFFGEPKELVILPGKAGGGFGPGEGLRAPDGSLQAGALAVGDFNGDQRTDVVLLGADVLEMYYQRPEGGLAKPLRLAHGIKNPMLMLTVDVNGDHRDDLLISADDDQYGLCVYLQEANGGLGAMRRIRTPKTRSLTVARSGKAADDVFVIEAETGRLKELHWDAPTEIGVAEDWPQRLYSYPLKAAGKRRPVAIGEVTGDGIADCVVLDPDAAQIILFAGTGTGLTSPTAFPGLQKALDVLIADVDGDGKNEVIGISEDERMAGVSKFVDGRLTFPTPLPVRGAPLVLAVGAAQAGGTADRIAYVSRENRKLQLVTAGIRGGVEENTIALEDLEDDPAAIRFADVNQDGRNDLLLFERSGPLRPFIQSADGKFAAMEGKETRAELVKEVSPEGFDLVDVTGDGKAEVLLAQRNLARALIVKDGRWEIVDQYNPETADAQITGLTTIPSVADKQGRPIIALYDRKARDVIVLKARDDGAYAVAQTMPVGNFDLTAMRTMTLGDSAKKGSGPGLSAVLLADSERLMTLTPNEQAELLIEQHSYESKAKDAWLGDSVAGDINHDGVRDLVVVDMGKASLEVVTTKPDGALTNALRFQVFQGKRFADAPDSRGEPREVLIGDVTGDKIDDVVMIVHDRLIVYPGQ